MLKSSSALFVEELIFPWPAVQASCKGELTLKMPRSFIQPVVFNLEMEAAVWGGGEKSSLPLV